MAPCPHTTGFVLPAPGPIRLPTTPYRARKQGHQEGRRPTRRGQSSGPEPGVPGLLRQPQTEERGDQRGLGLSQGSCAPRITLRAGLPVGSSQYPERFGPRSQWYCGLLGAVDVTL